MKFYYLTVGLAGLAATFYLNFTYSAEPGWVIVLISYACSTHIGHAVSTWIRERHDVKDGGPW